MRILRVAAKMEKKLAIASGFGFANIEAIRRAVRDLLSLKDLFLNASNDRTTTQITLNNLDTTSRMYYLTARDYGLSRSHHAGYLQQLTDDVNYLSEIKGKTQTSGDPNPQSHIDPRVYPKLDAIRTMLHNSIPIALAPQRANSAAPTQTPTPAPQPPAAPAAPVVSPAGPATPPAPSARQQFHEALERAKALRDEIDRREKAEQAAEEGKKDWQVNPNWTYRDSRLEGLDPAERARTLSMIQSNPR
jgi:hypothetical protein